MSWPGSKPSPCAALAATSVQTHSRDSSADDGPLLCRHTGRRVRPLASPRTGSGRCPGQNWFPAFPTELVRGLKAHGKTRTEAELNRLNMSEGWANFVLTRFIVAFAGYLRAKHDA